MFFIKKQNKKTPMIFRIALVLLCVMMVSFRLTGGLYARYASTATAEDSARVAVFHFEFTEDYTPETFTFPASLYPGESIEKEIRFSNKSEVSLRCVVTVDNLTHNLPIADCTFTSEIVPVDGSGSVLVTIQWPAGDNSIDYMGKSDVLKLTVKVEQVD